jgi:putative ABC transport system substrate-binding protein
MRRRELLFLLGGAAIGWPLAARAQQKAMPVIGFLSSNAPGPAAPLVAAFRQSLSDNGYVEGKNVAIEYRWAEARFDRLPAMAADLVGRKVDVIVAAGGTPPILAAKAATPTIPIVFANAGNPVETGLVASLARPGGNLTGVSILFAELTLKRIELLAELVPQARVIGLLVNPKNPTNETTVGDPRAAARTKGVQLAILKASSEAEIDAAFASLAPLQAGALIVSPDVLFTARREQVVALASRAALPAIYGWREFVEVGGLISYAPSVIGTYRQAAIYAAKILKGAKPADLPVEQPTQFELVINLKTAQALGLTVPQTLLARADEVIE